MINLTHIPGLVISLTERADGSLRNLEHAKQFAEKYLPHPLTVLKLEHGVEIRNTEEVSKGNNTGDTILTTHIGQAIGFVVGDCYPIVLYVPKKNILCQIHAGWKSLAQGIIPITLSHLEVEFHASPSEIIAWIGPGIDSEHYVHPSKPSQIDQPGWTDVIYQDEAGFHIDLQAFILNTLKAHGVPKHNIDLFPESTGKHPEKYFSHFRSKQTGEEDGRFLVASVMVR